MCHGACVVVTGQPVRVSSLQHGDPGNLTRVIKLSGKHLYVLSHLGGPIINLYLGVECSSFL